MTIPKRLKRKRGGRKIPPPVDSQEVQKVEAIMKKLENPPMDKMVRTYPRFCPKCNKPTYSTLCACGKLTVVTK